MPLNLLHSSTILIFHKVAADVAFLRELFEAHGASVLTTTCVETAWSLLNEALPDALLIGAKNAALTSADEICRRMRSDERTNEIPVFLIIERLNERNRVFAAGAVDYLIKPFCSREVITRIQAYLLQRGRERERLRCREAEDALAAKKEQLALITDHFQALVAYVDASRHYVYVNKSYAAWYGFSKEDMIGKAVKDTLDRDAYERAYKLHEKVLHGERISFENIAPNQAGEMRNLWVDLVPHWGPDGEVWGFLGLIIDTTEIKRTEEALRDAKQAAEAANQAKSEFLANMSHELRTPLNVVLGFSQILARDPHTPKETEALAVIQRSGEHLLTLINQVLDLSKIEAGRVTYDEKDCALYDVVSELKEMFALRTQTQGIALSVEFADDVPRYVLTDEVKLRQILINLLNNALKFTHGGEIALRVLREDSEPFNPQRPVRLRFDVQDSGVGIAPEEREMLFQKFVQTESGRQSHEGTGLGLAITQKFVELMGGEIRVESRPGKGSLFTCILPMKANEESADENSRRAPRLRRAIALEPGQPRYRMLIVDDKPDNRNVLLSLLAPFASSTASTSGFELREAQDGLEAMKIWQDWKPHLIWMDLRMPQLDGYTATQRIKATPQGRQTIVIVLSASIIDAERIAVIAAGCDAFLHKPFREDELFDLIRKHLGVRFVYEAEEAESEASDAVDLTPADLAVLPADYLKEFEEALILADIFRVKELIEAIRDEHAALAEALWIRVDNFEYETIFTLIRRIPSRQVGPRQGRIPAGE